MSVIVDASVAFKWFVPAEPLAAPAAALLRDDARLIAPDLLVAEVCNAAWRSVRRGDMAAGHAVQIASVLPGLFSALVEGASLAPRAVAIACELGHPVYDCVYLALAEARQLKLVTADTRLLAKLSGTAWQSIAYDLAHYASPKS